MLSKTLQVAISLAVLVPTSFGLPTVACPGRNASTGKAIYLLANDQANAVVAIPIGADGLLSGGVRTPTGGAGSSSIDGTTGEPASPDALVSQSALTVAGKHLFAVNPGSNTLTMFAIDPSSPSTLTMIGNPVPVPGEFPNTVAASAKHQLVCVGTSGARSGIACSPFSPRTGIAAMDALRPVDLRQTTPPTGPLNTVSQVFFSGDESALFATVKGDPAANKTGFFGSFPVQTSGGGGNYTRARAAAVSAQGTMTSPNGTAVLFGSSVIPRSNGVFVTDASFGAAILNVNARTGAVTVKGKGTIAGQKATCWSAVSPLTNSAFVTDVALNRLVEMSLADASVKNVVDLGANGDPGLIDLAVAGRFLYALSPGNGTTPAAVTVVDVISRRQVQHFRVDGLGVGKTAQGMAVSL